MSFAHDALVQSIIGDLELYPTEKNFGEKFLATNLDGSRFLEGEKLGEARNYLDIVLALHRRGLMSFGWVDTDSAYYWLLLSTIIVSEDLELSQAMLHAVPELSNAILREDAFVTKHASDHFFRQLLSLPKVRAQVQSRDFVLLHTPLTKFQILVEADADPNTLAKFSDFILSYSSDEIKHEMVAKIESIEEPSARLIELRDRILAKLAADSN